MQDIGFSLEDYCFWMEGCIQCASRNEGGLLEFFKRRKDCAEEAYLLDDYIFRKGIQELIRMVIPQLDRNYKGFPDLERFLKTDLPYHSTSDRQGDHS